MFHNLQATGAQCWGLNSGQTMTRPPAGTEKSLIRIWEVKQQKNVATFEGHARPIKGLAFSENGFHLASVSEDCVKLWDLRKLRNFK